jgi:DNA-binding response OmpR family regulator
MKEDVLKGYKVGADDYPNKPFDSEVLLMKIKAIIQRKASDVKTDHVKFEFQIGNFHLNSKRFLTYKNDEPIKLSPKENELLKMLAVYENDLMPRELALQNLERRQLLYFKVWIFHINCVSTSKPMKAVEILNIHGEGFRLVVKNKVSE